LSTSAAVNCRNFCQSTSAIDSDESSTSDMSAGRHCDLVGARVALNVGSAVGSTVGVTVGRTEGSALGSALGSSVGVALGSALGSSVGVTVGENDGLSVVGGRVVGSSVGT
jgi:hypothetical protein